MRALAEVSGRAGQAFLVVVVAPGPGAGQAHAQDTEPPNSAALSRRKRRLALLGVAGQARLGEDHVLSSFDEEFCTARGLDGLRAAHGYGLDSELSRRSMGKRLAACQK